MTRLLLSLLLCVMLLACNNSKSQAPTKTSEDANNEAYLKIIREYASDSQFWRRLSYMDFAAADVVKLCQEIADPAVKSKFIRYITTRAKNQLEEAKQGFWGAIRYNMDNFVQTVSSLKTNQHKTFMDIGCGNGEKLFAAMCLGFEKVHGLEYSPDSKKLAETFLAEFIKAKKVDIQQGDALEIDTKYYATADFVYMYSPMKDNAAMARLFKRVMEGMKDNAIFLEVRNVYFRELKAATGYRIPQYKGWLAIKREGDKYYYRTSLENDEWYTLEKI